MNVVPPDTFTAVSDVWSDAALLPSAIVTPDPEAPFVLRTLVLPRLIWDVPPLLTVRTGFVLSPINTPPTPPSVALRLKVDPEPVTVMNGAAALAVMKTFFKSSVRKPDVGHVMIGAEFVVFTLRSLNESTPESVTPLEKVTVAIAALLTPNCGEPTKSTRGLVNAAELGIVQVPATCVQSKNTWIGPTIADAADTSDDQLVKTLFDAVPDGDQTSTEPGTLAVAHAGTPATVVSTCPLEPADVRPVPPWETPSTPVALARGAAIVAVVSPLALTVGIATVEAEPNVPTLLLTVASTLVPIGPPTSPASVGIAAHVDAPATVVSTWPFVPGMMFAGAADTAAVVMAVANPLPLKVTIGIVVADPNVPTLLLTVASTLAAVVPPTSPASVWAA